MSGSKKTDSQMNAKIQQKFDNVFPVSSQKTDENRSTIFTEAVNFDSDGDGNMGTGAHGKTAPKIDLDLSSESEELEITTAAEDSTVSQTKTELDFTLDFDYSKSEIENNILKSAESSSGLPTEDAGFSLDGIENLGADLGDATKKTIIFDAKAFAELGSLTEATDEEIEQERSTNNSVDVMTRAESKASIESTIKDILKPKFDSTKDFNLNELVGSDDEEIAAEEIEVEEEPHDFDASLIDFSSNQTPSEGFLIKNILEDEDEAVSPPKTGNTGEFSLSADELNSFAKENSNMPSAHAAASPVANEPFVSGSLGSEDSLRFQATIRQLREEREELLLQVKKLKQDSKETEQDNLSFKASLDEAKIEITILRKRHMVELEDIKYRLSVSEEKKALADEKARQADLRREKLEQKVRIDFNQVKQREKELESKLELLSMDVDSQVQSRDHKILELRRKIDALEFNMENTTIKEQRSQEDKRKLEDRLNKIMKTLRNSIKNLEDDIDLSPDDDHNADKN